MKALSPRKAMQSFVFLLVGLFSVGLYGQTTVDDIEFVSLPGDQFQIELVFSERPPEPEIFLIENPARLSLDFADVVNGLAERRYPLEFNNAESVVVLEAQGRTRMVINLASATTYSSRIQGNSLFLTVGDDVAAGAGGLLAAAAQGAGGVTQQSASADVPVANTGDIRSIDFRRGANGDAQILIDLANTNLVGNVNRADESLTLEFLNAELAESLQMRLDVTDFATPVQFVDVYEQNDNTVIMADIAGDFDYIAYQSGGQYILSINPVVAAGAAGGAQDAFPFSGERITLNFQDIDVRTVLQILADFNDFSLVVSDTVSGNITLRLDDVPWDQALDLVLRARGLDQRVVGSVLYIAPAEEIADAELQQLQNEQQLVSLAPLQTEYIEINYAVATELLALIQSSGQGAGGAAGGAGGAGGGQQGGGLNNGLLTARGRASVDTRTNTLIIQDVESSIQSVRELVERLDVPVRQVQIEARIVNASTNFGRNLGIEWGGVRDLQQGGGQFILSGSQEALVQERTGLAEFNRAVAEAVAGGATLAEAQATTERQTVSFPDALAVDLGVSSPTTSFALGYLSNSGLLQLELSALESTGNGEVIAQPKVATQDQQTARIESGLSIPYQAQAGGTAGGSTTEFVPAVLSLEVTPQITPDNNIIMLLDIHQDSVVPGSGTVPAISTNAVNTRVLVNDGETVVLGGVFRVETTTAVSKTPVLGDLPYVGNLFKRTENNETKTELLIFITPTIINERM